MALPQNQNRSCPILINNNNSNSSASSIFNTSTTKLRCIDLPKDFTDS